MEKFSQFEILDISNRRYATKAFDADREVSEDDLRTILEVGRLSPSSFGYEPWKFLVIENEELREEIYDIAPGARNAIHGDAKLIIILYRKDVNYKSEHVIHIVEDVLGLEYDPESPITQGFRGFQENLLELKSEEDINNWSRRQTFIPLANMMTAAASLDLDCVAIEGFIHSALTDLLREKNIIDTDKYEPSVLMAVGYRNEEIKPKRRRQFEEVVEFII